jgi:hypothetical protein
LFPVPRLGLPELALSAAGAVADEGIHLSVVLVVDDLRSPSPRELPGTAASRRAGSRSTSRSRCRGVLLLPRRDPESLAGSPSQAEDGRPRLVRHCRANRPRVGHVDEGPGGRLDGNPQGSKRGCRRRPEPDPLPPLMLPIWRERGPSDVGWSPGPRALPSSYCDLRTERRLDLTIVASI